MDIGVLPPPPRTMPGFSGKIAPLCGSSFLNQASGEAMDSHENFFPAGIGGGRLFFPKSLEQSMVWKPHFGKHDFFEFLSTRIAHGIRTGRLTNMMIES